jgi:AraC-like DNA-binding protein
MGGTVLTVSSRALLEYCDKLGVDTGAILRTAGLERAAVDDPDGRLPLAQARNLWRLAYQASGDPDLALHAAEALRFGAYRVIDYLAGSAPTVGAAIAQVSAYFPIINSAVRLPITTRTGDVAISLVCPDDPAHITRPYVEYTFAAVFLRVREATNVRYPLARVEFAFAAPASTAEHERIFECPVRFGAADNLMRVSRDAWDTPSSRADADLFGVLADHARILGQKIPSEPAPIQDVRRALLERLNGGDLSLDSVAKQLAMSPRTLQRRLREHGLSFADLLDSVRASAAKSYLTDQQISVAEVAYLLGFAEQSSFNHAFKRWTGQAPGEFRKQS